ncbi:2',5' RNA ligase family [mine drainage metagenome]|uniref:2',5' RNA ligase family n=1 Tax=mine drainage metagenome TaxID=410659 RepID=A0A1J5QD44_9ZZZZ
MRLPERGDDEIRIGVALTVPEPYGSALQAARASFGDPLAPFIPPHITLLGPTVVAEDELDALGVHLAEIASQFRPFVLHLRGTGSFRPVSPVVFVQVVEGISICEDLERAVRSGPLEQELRFNYHPHVTVAHEVDEDALERAFDGLAGFEASFVMDGFQSYHHGDDGVWRPVMTYPFAGHPSLVADAARGTVS